ncbi:MAG: response regulator transcription factor, partial [Actinobacteria bacterium]|nr:response regulator transcription factor [Actinomycetota bacterium]
MPNAVLVAEPEPATREYLGRQLRDDGFDVLGAARRSEALELAERIRPDVVLLAELDLCIRLRRGEPGRTWDRNVPMILLAPSSDPVERVRALDRGADDVMGRPFAYEELLARIRALLRRSTTSSTEVLLAGELIVDRRTRRVSVREMMVSLSAKEFELLARLAAEPYRVFTKEELLREVWGYRALGRTRTLESHASRLRKKLRLAEGDSFVVNMWGVGGALEWGVGVWRDVASHLTFRHFDGMALRVRSRTFGHGLGTRGRRVVGVRHPPDAARPRTRSLRDVGISRRRSEDRRPLPRLAPSLPLRAEGAHPARARRRRSLRRLPHPPARSAFPEASALP